MCGVGVGLDSGAVVIVAADSFCISAVLTSLLSLGCGVSVGDSVFPYVSGALDVCVQPVSMTQTTNPNRAIFKYLISIISFTDRIDQAPVQMSVQGLKFNFLFIRIEAIQLFVQLL